MPGSSTSLRLGDAAPDFALVDSTTGATISLQSLLGEHSWALLAFHRGMWCPNCRGQLGEMRDSLPRLEAHGVAAAAVLPQSCARIAGALQRYGSSYPFPLLCDERREVVKSYGVWHPIGVASFNTAHPACFLVDRASRRIRYAFVGRSQAERIDIDAVLQAIS